MHDTETIADRGCKGSDMFYARFPGRMTDGVIHLRYMKISDGLYLRRQLADREVVSYSLLSRPVSRSWFHVWLKMYKLFDFAYVIVVDVKPVGFVGLYDFIPAQSTKMSLVIFNREKRRQGYGSRAFNLMVNNLQTYSMVRSVFVTYNINNADARSFWSRCGFRENCRKDDQITMVRDLKMNYPSAGCEVSKKQRCHRTVALLI
jgi:RimJ/RimL family protein N-acetyltransferase